MKEVKIDLGFTKIKPFDVEPSRPTKQSFLDKENESEIDTLGGLICSLVGRVPGHGECVRHNSGIEFQIIEGDTRRIRKVKIRGLNDEKLTSSKFINLNESN